ncbi:MAG: MBL fold metallo-hydrolase [Pseudarcicella sp.]|nr:MBL fold metallo-hydrolase [Pseudarcicella sp.]MBP6411185.1 MBL fold metallo-hydrolase [Pseudarcicella sp.]
MITIKTFTFNQFRENTYVLSDETKQCIIIDPGCYEYEERRELTDYITEQNLKVTHLLNTHAHIDHVLGNDFVKRNYGVSLYLHQNEIPILEGVKEKAIQYGFPHYQPTEPDFFINENDKITFGESVLEILFVPGHAPGHLAFVNREQKICISGDVLFNRSVGRADFPLSSYKDLKTSLREKMYLLPEDTIVYPGHGPVTTIGEEKKYNPYIKPLVQ